MKKATLYVSAIILLVWVGFSISHYVYVPRQLDSPYFTENVEVPPRAKKYIVIQPFHTSQELLRLQLFIFMQIFL